MTEIWQLSIKESGSVLIDGTEREVRLMITIMVQAHGFDIFDKLDVNAFFRYNDPTRKDQWKLTIDDVEKWYDEMPL
jgi:hypothetical protein